MPLPASELHLNKKTDLDVKQRAIVASALSMSRSALLVARDPRHVAIGFSMTNVRSYARVEWESRFTQDPNELLQKKKDNG